MLNTKRESFSEVKQNRIQSLHLMHLVSQDKPEKDAPHFKIISLIKDIIKRTKKPLLQNIYCYSIDHMYYT